MNPKYLSATQSLWDFACRCYARPGVAALCLDEQQRGANVCWLLTLLWFEHSGRTFTQERYHALSASAEHWHEQIIRPVRALRQDWKAGAAGDPSLQVLREQLKQLELACEQALLERLEHLARDWPCAAPNTDWLEFYLSPESAKALRLAI